MEMTEGLSLEVGAQNLINARRKIQWHGEVWGAFSEWKVRFQPILSHPFWTTNVMNF